MLSIYYGVVTARSQNDLIVCAVYTGTFGSSRVICMACVICHNCILNALCAIVAMIFARGENAFGVKLNCVKKRCQAL